MAGQIVITDQWNCPVPSDVKLDELVLLGGRGPGPALCSGYGVTPPSTAGTNPSHPDAFIGDDNSLYLGKPRGWLRVPCSASPTGFIAIPAYIIP